MPTGVDVYKYRYENHDSITTNQVKYPLYNSHTFNKWNNMIISELGIDTDFAGFYEQFNDFSNEYYYSKVFPTKVDPIKSNLSVKVFPNPTTNKISIVTSAQYKNATLEMFTISGKLVFTKTLTSNDSKEIDVSSLNSGLYIYRIETNNRSGIDKLLIK